MILMMRQGRTYIMTTNWTAQNPKALLKWACFFTLFLGSSVVAQSNVEFRLSCKVMDNIVIAADEGRPQRYNHYTDQFEVGDTLDVLVELRPSNSLYLRLRDPLRDEIVAGTVASFEQIRYYDPGSLDFLADNSSELHGFSISGVDAIEFDNGEEVTLRRYYRDDWQGVFLADNGLTVQVAVLDCRVSGRNNLAEITDRLKAIAIKWDE